MISCLILIFLALATPTNMAPIEQRVTTWTEYYQLLKRVCSTLPLDERRRRQIHEYSHWDKQTYFDVIKNITMPWCLNCMNTTTRTYPQSPMDFLLSKQKLCQPHIKRKQKWFFFGDSITGEVSKGLGMVLDMNKYEFVQRHQYVELPVEKFDNISQKILGTKANFFVFDTSILHRNFRKYQTFDNVPKLTDYMYKYIGDMLQQFTRLSELHRKTTKTFWVGTPNLEAWVQNSHPRKNDSHTFYDSHYIDIWQSVEREMLAQEAEKRAHFDWINMERLTNMCPGVRCDGLHFFAHWPRFNCGNTSHLVAMYLADQLITRHNFTICPT